MGYAFLCLGERRNLRILSYYWMNIIWSLGYLGILNNTIIFFSIQFQLNMCCINILSQSIGCHNYVRPWEQYSHDLINSTTYVCKQWHSVVKAISTYTIYSFYFDWTKFLYLGNQCIPKINPPTKKNPKVRQ